MNFNGENFTEDKENTKINQTEIMEMKNTIIELKSSLEGFSRKLDQKEEGISKLKD